MHKKTDRIAGFASERGLPLFSCDIKARRSPHQVGLETLRTYLVESERLWGLAPVDFLACCLDGSLKTLRLSEWVTHIEESGAEEEFLLVAYVDGGLISVSRAFLPFQTGAPAAEWWCD